MALGGANSLFTPQSTQISGFWKSRKARCELGAFERSQVNEFKVSQGHFRQVRTRQAWVQSHHCHRPASSVPALGGRGAERGAEIWKASPKPGCRSKELRVVGYMGGVEVGGGGAEEATGK